jgi:hypothetical protein
MRRDPLVPHLTSLPADPTDDDLRPLARAIAQRAIDRAAVSGARRPSPAKSIVKTCERCLAALHEDVRSAVIRLAYDELESVSAPAPQPLPVVTRDWEPLAAAAERRGLTVAELLRRLVWPQYRRMWGWPECRDGHRDWWFPIGADALHRAERDVEPYHLLPAHCRRVEEVDMCRGPAEGAA